MSGGREGAAVVLMTAPSDEVADRLAEAAVTERLAACVGALPGLRSVYRWQGKVERAVEVQLVFKTTTDRVPALIARLTALHPFDVPECIALDVSAGLPAYLQWINDETSPEGAS